jgi:hypothetical protein
MALLSETFWECGLIDVETNSLLFPVLSIINFFLGACDFAMALYIARHV